MDPSPEKKKCVRVQTHCFFSSIEYVKKSEKVVLGGNPKKCFRSVCFFLIFPFFFFFFSNINFKLLFNSVKSFNAQKVDEKRTLLKRQTKCYNLSQKPSFSHELFKKQFISECSKASDLVFV